MITQRVSELRSSLKAQLGLPARVIFLCENPALWNSFHTIVTEMQKDPKFEVILVRLWCKVYSKDGTYTYVAADFGEISERINQCFIESYNPETNTWLDLQKMEPDYVFYMRPYDYYRNEDYHISCVSKYTKTCYVPYGMTVIGGEVERFTMPKDFSKYLYYFFLDTPLRKPFIQEDYGQDAVLKEERVLCLGYPRMDLLRNLDTDNKQTDCCTMLWLPRWNTGENCCNFFEYKDILPEYAIKEENCHLIFRPHPLCFQNFLNTGELLPEELEALKQQFASEPNLFLDENGSYLESFLKSDVLIADETSLIAEYYSSGKPIVFCKKEMHISALMEKLAEGIYFVENWDELKATLTMLRGGNDPLYSKRLEIVERALFQTDKPSGELIKEQLVKDFYSQKM